MYAIKYAGRFRRDVKRCASRGLDIELLREAVAVLARTGALPRRYTPHKISGKFKNQMECHLQPDWLSVWQINGNELLLLATGTHADLF
jgi:mRNA interferase YafQ